MMAGIFLVISLAITAIFFKQRMLAMAIIGISVIFCLLMFFHHVTDVLKVIL